MARHEGDLRAADGQALSVDELLAILDEVAPPAQTKDRARACYLSSSEGWREAVKQLDGAFASVAMPLTGAKEE